MVLGAEGAAVTDQPAIDLSTRITLRAVEAAASLGVSEKTLRTLGVPCIRSGRVVLYAVSELQKWAAANSHSDEDRVAETVGGILEAVNS